MLSIGLLFATVAFASIQAPILLEHETQVVTKDFLGKQFTRIFSCSQSGADFLPNVPDLANTATQVVITYNPSYGPQQFVYSKPETYPIRRLRAGNTLSFQIKPPATDEFASSAIIQRDWVGPAFLLAKLWNSCGSAKSLTGQSALFYWACNNQNGLHLGAGQTCMWDWSLKYQNPIEIYIDAGSRPNSGPFVPPPPPGGCETCRVYEGKRWSRIYSCTPSAAQFGFSVSDTINLAQQATQVLINNAAGYYVTSNPGSYPIQRLRLGQTISFALPPDNWAEPEDVAANWKGPSFLIDSLWSACGAAGPFTTNLFWACNNQAGLHLTSGHCEWDWQSPNGQIEVFIDAPCSCPYDQPPPPPPAGGEAGNGGGYGYY